MKQTDDIDFLLTLNPHGWSTCFLYVRDKSFEFTITHIFNDPYSELIQALIKLIDGEKEATFYWYGEPGGHRFEFKINPKQHHKITVIINEFGEVYDDEPKEYDLTFAFEIKLSQLIIIFYTQLQKTKILLKDRQFAESRIKNFPFQELERFEETARQLLDL